MLVVIVGGPHAWSYVVRFLTVVLFRLSVRVGSGDPARRRHRRRSIELSALRQLLHLLRCVHRAILRSRCVRAPHAIRVAGIDWLMIVLCTSADVWLG